MRASDDEQGINKLWSECGKADSYVTCKFAITRKVVNLGDGDGMQVPSIH